MPCEEGSSRPKLDLDGLTAHISRKINGLANHKIFTDIGNYRCSI